MVKTLAQQQGGNSIFNSKNSAFNMTNKKRIEEKGITPVVKTNANASNQLFESLKKIPKLD